MTLRFAGKGARLVGAASAAAACLVSALALPLGCATGDAPLEADPPGGDSGAPPVATEAGSADDPTQGDDAQVVPDATAPDNDSSANADSDPPVQDASDAGVVDGADAADSAPANDSGGGTGVLCGSGASPTLRCTGATPLCCETSGAYACVAAGACSGGYAIACATATSCPGTYACCHYNSGIKCESSCPIANTMCDPAAPGGCGSGHSCNVPVALAGSATPYMTCSP